MFLISTKEIFVTFQIFFSLSVEAATKDRVGLHEGRRIFLLLGLYLVTQVVHKYRGRRCR